MAIADSNIGKPFRSAIGTRPVIAATAKLNFWLDGTNPRGYHLFNLVVHIAAVTLFELLRRTLRLPRGGDDFGRRTDGVALVAALVWLVLPLNTQAVTDMVQRCESMMDLFFLLGLLCFLRGATASRRAGWWYAGAFVSAALGAGCKEVMIAFPPVLVLYDQAFVAGSCRTWRSSIACICRWRRSSSSSWSGPRCPA